MLAAAQQGRKQLFPLDIVLWPDARLTTPCEPVTVFDDGLRQRARRLLDTVQFHAQRCVGLAANQAGLTDRMFATRDEVFINPEIIEASKKTKRKRESCMSMPGHFAVVERHNWVSMRFYDTQGNKHERLRVGTFDAQIWQHEIDHLNGITLRPPEAHQ
jgi:peptide deformylase